MSESDNLPTTDEQIQNQPVVQGTGDSDVKDIDAVSDDHPLVQETGMKALETQTESGAGEFLSDFIYEHDSAWVREWLQNEETACVRASKLLIQLSDKYPDGWLKQTKWISKETGETVMDEQDQSVLAEYDFEPTDVREIEIARPIDEVLEAARSLGYDPTIVWDVYRDERKILTEDNGIGMTPYEFDKAFNTIFSSGAALDSETGGMFGVGSESSALVHGKNGGAKCTTASRRPTDDGEDYDGFHAYSYLGGANPLPGEVDDDFKGTLFDIPVQESFDLDNLQGWVEDYTEALRVPLLYREHDAGSTPVEEEYEATTFTENYDDPPVVIEKPGEYTVLAGPSVIETGFHADDEDTFLVSMPIDRNSRTSISTFWDTVIQIHDEQGRIVAGPNRGRYADGNKVFPTASKNEAIGKMDDDDVMTPEPTGDRDRLQRDSNSKKFFNHIEEVVTERELNQVGDIAERMKEADHPAEAIRENESDWTLFKKMVDYHGDRYVTDSSRNFKDFIDEWDTFPDFERDTLNQVYGLFKKVEHAPFSGYGIQTKKDNRGTKPLGDILASVDNEKVHMAASTGGKFKDRYRVIENTHPEGTVIVISGATKYDTYEKNFGFKKVKEVPVRFAPDGESHDYDVPQKIHDKNEKKKSSYQSKPDEILDRALKLRTDGGNSSIDQRLTIEAAQQKLENNKTFDGHSKLVLFPSGQDYENISDHYDMAGYAAIASVSKTEYDELADYDDVMLLDEFKEWSRSALIATEDGAMTPGDLIADDRMVVLAYRSAKDHEVVQLLADENEQLRTYYAEDIRDQFSWASHLDGYDGGYRGSDVGKVPDDDKRDTLFAVAGRIVLSRAEWAFDEPDFIDKMEMAGLKLSREKYDYNTPCEWYSLDRTTTHYQLMADTPKWDDSSDIYEILKNKTRGGQVSEMYLAFHDRGIDPSKKDPSELRELIN